MKFRCATPIKIRFRDTDALGHVNNAVYLSYLEMGRADYWNRLFGVSDFAKVDFIFAHASIDYRSPAFMGEDLIVHSRVSRIGTKSFDFQCEIREASGGRLVAEAVTTQVMYDYAAGKSKPVPGEVKEKLLAFEGAENVSTSPGRANG